MEASNEELNGPAQSSLPLDSAPSAADTPAAETSGADTTDAPAKAPAKRAPRKRAAPKKAATTDTATAAGTQDPATAGTGDPSGETPAAPAKAPAKRAPRTRKPAASKAATGAPEAPAPEEATAQDATGEQAAEVPQKPTRAPRTRKSTAKATAPAADPSTEAPAAGDDAVAGGAAGDDEAVAAPAKARRTRKTPSKAAAATATTSDEAHAEAAVAPESAAPETAPAPSGPAPSADPFASAASPVSLLFQAPDLSTVVPATRPAESTESDQEGDGAGTKNRQGRRNRPRSREESNGTGENSAEPQHEQDDDEGNGSDSRRRRRRRRGDADLELTGGHDDDPPNTVTRVRGPRAAAEPAPSNKVTSVKGSTRLEAKRQRRRDSRDAGRRRHVITEAEFLARRESVDRQMVVRQREDRIQIGVLEDGVLAEHFVSKTQQDSLIGNVYVGKVQNVLPSMEAAFIDIGRGRNAVLYAGEVNWDVAGLEGQPRRIEHALKSGDSVLVQVTKDPVGHKGARLTSQISLPGRYLVYVPGGSMTGISRKLPDVERNRLKKILKDHLPQNAGVIVRTAAEGASEQELMNDINRLRAQWEGIEAASTSTKTTPPELLYAEPDLTIKVVRDVFNEDFTKLIVSGDAAWDTIEAYVMYVAPDLIGRLQKWTSETDIFASHRIEEQIHKALERKVFLPSGGSLVIDRTEAMTVVDVNTGKFTGSGGNLEETVTKNNLEAAEEIVRQLRLRDIGGIIVIDFIDMVLEANRDLVLRRLVECLGRDRTKHQVAEVTSLGLVQMTRKRMGTGLLEVFSENCEACNGRGVVTHDEPVEHRRAANAPGDSNQHKRNDRKPRNDRRHGKSGEADHTTEFTAPEPKPQDPAAEAKAEAARAAFASIAAAAHAAHDQDGAAVPPAGNDGDAPTAPRDAPAGGDDASEGQREGGSRRRGRGRARGRGRSGTEDAPAQGVHGEEQPAPDARESGASTPAIPAAGQHVDATRDEAEEDGQLVSIAGEAVRLPRARRSRRATAPAQAPDLTLESLSAAFGAAPEPERQPQAPEGQAEAPGRPAETPAAAAAPQAPAPAAVQAPEPAAAPAAVPARRVRRSRSASSAQGGANMPIERKEAPASSAAAGISHVAKLDTAAAGQKKVAPVESPVMLGVGVPADQL